MEENERENYSELLIKFEQMLISKNHLYFDIDEYEELIEYYLNEGDYNKAQKAVSYAREQFPFSIEILIKKAHLSLFTNDVDSSIKDIHQYLDDNGFDEGLLTVLSSLYLDKGSKSKTLQCLDKIVEEYGDSSDIYYLYGSTYLALGENENAVNYFKKSVELDIENEAALYDLAYCLELDGKLEESISFYRNFINQDPYSYFAWYNLGVIYNKLDNYEKAIESFEFSIAINDEFSSAYYNLGNTYVMQQEWEKAITAFKRCEKLENPSADLYSKLGECFELRGLYQKSIEYYKKALEIDPEKESALLGIASVLFDAKRYKEAIHYAQKSTKHNEYQYHTWLTLAKCEAALGNDFSAVEAFDKSIELNYNNNEIVYIEYANFYYDKQDYKTALSIIQEGIEVLPENGEYFYLACIYSLKEGKYKEAIAFLENALFLAPEKKEMLFEYFESIDEQKAILALINQLD